MQNYKIMFTLKYKPVIFLKVGLHFFCMNSCDLHNNENILSDKEM